MTVGQYQKVYEINQTTLDDIERVATLICFVFNKAEEEINNIGSVKFLKLADKLTKRLQVKEPFLNQIRLETDASKITLGQFIECVTWLKNDVISVLHLVAASTLINPKPLDHALDAEKLLSANIGSIYLQVIAFEQSLQQLILSYKGLFEIEEEIDQDGNKVPSPPPHPFIDQFGWIFSAKQVAEHEGITLDQAFSLPVIQALNVLSYLKSKQAFDKWQAKQ